MKASSVTYMCVKNHMSKKTFEGIIISSTLISKQLISLSLSLQTFSCLFAVTRIIYRSTIYFSTLTF